MSMIKAKGWEEEYPGLSQKYVLEIGMILNLMIPN